MPFTLAHPAAVLPLKWVKRSWFSTTGLVVGSMAPDYEYFMQQQHTPTISETTMGVFLFDIPLALLVALVFHLLVKRPLQRHLPQPLDRKYSGFSYSSFLSYLGKHWGVFAISLLIGLGSHLLLDWLTNPELGPFADTFLTQSIAIGPREERPLILMERFYDVLGTLALLVVVAKMNNPLQAYTSTTTTHKTIYWSLLFLTVLAIMSWEWREAGGFDGVGKTITTLIWAVVGGLVTASVLIRLLERQPVP